jgi:S-adenosylmethionine:tRNA ribosyltransferase-isomerase
MISASVPRQRPPQARMLILNAEREIQHHARSGFTALLRPNDLVVANDAATLPASLSGTHESTGRTVEVRLAGRESLRVDDVKRFSAVVFGAGDFRTRTEDRPWPPGLHAEDRLELGPLRATVVRVLHHPRFISLELEGSPSQIWEGLARHGRPIQYSHIASALAVRDVWTPIAGPPVALEPPSAGFVLDWSTVSAIQARGARFATMTHAAGISSTGDEELDRLLPFDEPYRIPPSTADAIEQTRRRGGRVIAVGTTVVRALEHALARPGEGVATQRIGPHTPIHVIDALISGTHEPGTSHYELMRAFADDETLQRVDRELESSNYTTHEFGDSIFIEKTRRTAGYFFGSMANPNIESPAPTTTY